MISIFDLFSIGIGPSSSHTVGPMKAALRFAWDLSNQGLLDTVEAIEVDLFGSLALTGKGHHTDRAVILGLLGESPESVEGPHGLVDEVLSSERLALLKEKEIAFPYSNIRFNRMKRLDYHTNAMTLIAKSAEDKVLLEATYYSVGGGFIVSESEAQDPSSAEASQSVELPYTFGSAAELLALCEKYNKSIAELIKENERVRRNDDTIRTQLRLIWETMKACISRGCHTEGILPGGLNIKRRAPGLFHQLTHFPSGDPAEVMDWVSLFALAVNEENAGGGKVVTAPTNGAAGIVPAVLQYYDKFYTSLDNNDEALEKFFFTAGAIGLLYKMNASISGAEMGCQGEVGVACSMAAAGLAALRDGTVDQIENAAEIGMEHNLGLTCDPVKGLVQIPCIERNTMGAIKAINASRLALAGDGCQKVSLDKVIKTMRQTGLDMKTRYKETSQGGLAINVVEC